MKASVVIPVLNGGELFRQVIERVLEQKATEEYEVIIVDSGSTDGSVEYVRSKRDGPVPVTLEEIPKAEFGHGKTRNLGASLSKGEFIAFLTQDALPVDEHWLQNLVAAADQDPDIAGAFGKHLPYPDCHPLTSRDIQAHMRVFDDAPNVAWLEDRERYKSDSSYRQFLHFFSNNNSCVRGSIWRRIPFPDVPYGEDQTWARKIIERGYKKAYAQEAMVYHSHNYSFRERINHFRVQYRFWKAYFNYNEVASLRHLVRATWHLTRGDLEWLRSENHPLTPLAFARVAGHNFSRLMGSYLGYRDALKIQT